MISGAKTSNLELIAGIAAHDLYHAGQIQLIKRLQNGKSDDRTTGRPDYRTTESVVGGFSSYSFGGSASSRWRTK